MAGLRTILDMGYRIHSMNASLPEISSVSWTSFMTGRNPGEHGIFGFTHLQPGSYGPSLPEFKGYQSSHLLANALQKRESQEIPHSEPAPHLSSLPDRRSSCLWIRGRRFRKGSLSPVLYPLFEIDGLCDRRGGRKGKKRISRPSIRISSGAFPPGEKRHWPFLNESPGISFSSVSRRPIGSIISISMREIPSLLRRFTGSSIRSSAIYSRWRRKVGRGLSFHPPL